MRDKIYINGISGISAQPGKAIFQGEVNNYTGNIFPAIPADYKEHIPAMALRRMSKGIKMGLTAAKTALQDAGVEIPDAIITGTGQGCKQDTEKFLQEVLDREEELLSPTSFIQSTHNTVGGQIALNLECKGYNMTYTQNSASLESAFMDALLQLSEDPTIRTILVGGVDEISEKTTPFQNLNGQLKQGDISSLDLFKSNSPGTITSEGAHFFSLSAEKAGSAYAEIADVKIFNADADQEVSEEVQNFIRTNSLSAEDIDVVILGTNGDIRFDHFYEQLQTALFKNKPQLGYKHLVGDYDTVSGYAVWLACLVLQEEQIPEILKLNDVPLRKLQRVLIYNQYLGKNHSLILLSSV